MNHLTQVKQATASLTPSELRDLSAHIAALLAAEVVTSTNAPTCTSLTPGLNGRNNNHQTNDAPNWWERDRDDAWWQGEEWQALRQQVLGFVRSEAACSKATSANSTRLSLGGFSHRRVLPRGCWLDGKAIRGHGPYLYLRWRAGSRQRSKYLGKAPTPVAQRSVT